MRLLFAGTPEVAVPSLEAFIDSDHEVVGVLTRPDARAGRGRSAERMRYSPVKQVALEHDIPVLQPASLRDAEVQAQLAELAPDCCPVVAYGGMIPPAALAIPPHGWVNLHFSLLPAWRGAAPVQHAIIHGDDVTGASVFVVEKGLDTGPVVATMTETIRPQDTAGDLLERLSRSGAGLLRAAVDAIASGAAAPVPQGADGITQAPKITPEDAQVRWTRPGFAVDRLVRGCTPAPGAWTGWRGERVKLGPVSPHEDALEQALAPGELLVQKKAVLVGTATTPVRLGTVQGAGKKAMAATDWARGVRPEPGERFEEHP